jgi:hypothetical protein
MEGAGPSLTALSAEEFAALTARAVDAWPAEMRSAS